MMRTKLPKKGVQPNAPDSFEHGSGQLTSTTKENPKTKEVVVERRTAVDPRQTAQTRKSASKTRKAE